MTRSLNMLKVQNISIIVLYNIRPELEWPHYNFCGKANKGQGFLIMPLFKHQFHIHEGKCIQIINQVFTWVCLTCLGQLHPESYPHSRNSTRRSSSYVGNRSCVNSMIQHSRWQSLEQRSGMATLDKVLFERVIEWPGCHQQKHHSYDLHAIPTSSPIKYQLETVTSSFTNTHFFHEASENRINFSQTSR